MDNGAPFASQGPEGLSRLSVWWIGLGWLDTSAKPRLLPAFSDKSWETKPIKLPAN